MADAKVQIDLITKADLKGLQEVTRAQDPLQKELKETTAATQAEAVASRELAEAQRAVAEKAEKLAAVPVPAPLEEPEANGAVR